MSLSRLLRTLPLLAMLTTGFLALSPVQAQEESEADEQKTWEKFNDGFNKEERQDRRERQFLQGEEHLEPSDDVKLTEHLIQIFRLTPAKAKPGEFTSIKGTGAVRHWKNKSIWEDDRDRHGGSWWKVWEHEKDWSDRKNPWSIGKYGEILRFPKKP